MDFSEALKQLKQGESIRLRNSDTIIFLDNDKWYALNDGDTYPIDEIGTKLLMSMDWEIYREW